MRCECKFPSVSTRKNNKQGLKTWHLLRTSDTIKHNYAGKHQGLYLLHQEHSTEELSAEDLCCLLKDRRVAKKRIVCTVPLSSYPNRKTGCSCKIPKKRKRDNCLRCREGKVNKILLTVTTAEFKRARKDLFKPQFTVTVPEEHSRCSGDTGAGIPCSPCCRKESCPDYLDTDFFVVLTQ